MKYWSALVAIALVEGGCGKKDDDVAAPKSTTTVEGNSEKATVQYKGPGDSATATVDKTGAEKVTYKDEKGGKASVDTKANIDSKELGVDLYPGAKRLEGVGDSTKVNDSAGSNLTLRLSTSDKATVVGEFYKKHLKDAVVTTLGQTTIVLGKNAAGEDVNITLDPTKKKGTTEISVMVTKKK